MDLVTVLLLAEMLAFSALGLWMMWAVVQSARGNAKYNDSNRFILMSFSFLIVYRDARIWLLDDVRDAKIVMCVVGITLCVFTAAAARAYGRGVRL